MISVMLELNRLEPRGGSVLQPNVAEGYVGKLTGLQSYLTQPRSGYALQPNVAAGYVG
jgi:hypothetical protein